MHNNYFINSYCKIKDGKVILDNDILFSEHDSEYIDFIKAAYKHQKTKHPKFFKMDRLSKLAFLTADVLLKNQNLDIEEENDIALVFSNKASSLDTDRKHQHSISDKENYYPSPAVFVYTLPNICLGEISIKHKLHSENSFFIFDTFNAPHLLAYSTALLQQGKAEKVLCGWVDYDEGSYEAILFLISNDGQIEFNTNELTRLYNN